MQDRELNKKVLKKQREGNWTVCSKSRSGKHHSTHRTSCYRCSKCTRNNSPNTPHIIQRWTLELSCNNWDCNTYLQRLMCPLAFKFSSSRLFFPRLLSIYRKIKHANILFSLERNVSVFCSPFHLFLSLIFTKSLPQTQVSWIYFVIFWNRNFSRKFFTIHRKFEHLRRKSEASDCTPWLLL